MQRALEALKPKMYVLGSATPPEPVEAKSDNIGMGAQVERINQSKFTSKGDHSKVVKLYRDDATRKQDHLMQLEDGRFVGYIILSS